MVKGEISSEAETDELIKIFKEPPNQTDMRIINKQVSRKLVRKSFITVNEELMAIIG